MKLWQLINNRKLWKKSCKLLTCWPIGNVDYYYLFPKSNPHITYVFSLMMHVIKTCCIQMRSKQKRCLLKTGRIVEIFPWYWFLMNNTLYVPEFIWAFDALGSCFLELQLASHVNETTCGIHHNTNCPIINVQEKWMHGLLEASKDTFWIKVLVLNIRKTRIQVRNSYLIPLEIQLVV